MKVEALMPTARRRLTTINADASLTDAAKLLSDTQISLVVVCAADGSMAGVITKTDVVRQIAQGQEALFVTLGSGMAPLYPKATADRWASILSPERP